MKAMLLDRFGDASNFRLAEVERPAVKPGHLLVRVAAASVNPVDTKVRAAGPAFAPALPAALGCDCAGIVEAVGEGATGFAVGDAVYGCPGGVIGTDGTYAEWINADARTMAHKPAALDMRAAAALPLVCVTAWEALLDRARVTAGQTVLIHGGAGGVGHVAIQIAKAKGATVYATVSSDEKAAIARRLGADEVIFYRREQVGEYVERLTGGRGFDVVFDATGGSDIVTSFAAARLNGQVVTIVARYTADLALMHAKGLSLHVVFMLIPLIHGQAEGRAHHGTILHEVAGLVDSGLLQPLLDPKRFTLAEVAEAHRHLESGQAVGKIVIDVGAAGEAGAA